MKRNINLHILDHSNQLEEAKMSKSKYEYAKLKHIILTLSSEVKNMSHVAFVRWSDPSD